MFDHEDTPLEYQIFEQEISQEIFEALIYKAGRVEMGILYPETYIKYFKSFANHPDGGLVRTMTFKKYLNGSLLILMAAQCIFNTVF
jgi:hypothetical protein